VTKPVLVIGCTISGLLAAYAAEQAGRRVHIAAPQIVRDVPMGAQYLHRSIPGLTPDEAEATVDYELWGSVEGYRRKVYGPDAEVEVSPESLVGQHPAWDLRAAYRKLWKRYEGRIFGRPMGYHALEEVLRANIYERIISTYAALRLCGQPAIHHFRTEKVLIAMMDMEGLSPETVVCNGKQDIAWYRCSNIFGQRMTEWPYYHGQTVPLQHGLTAVLKPLSNDCDCWTGMPVLQVGRRGQWEKGVLAHHVYETVLRELS
jgi:hypothetical protein